MSPTPKAWTDGKTSAGLVNGEALIDLEERLQRGISGKDYKAKGDGKANDTKPIGEAILGAMGNILILHAGTFLIDFSTALTISSGSITIQGAGRDVTKLVCSNSSPTSELVGISVGNGAKAELRDLTIEGPSSIGKGGRFDAFYTDKEEGELRARRVAFRKFTTAARVSSSVNWQGAVDLQSCIFEGYGGEGDKKSTPVLVNSHGTGSRGRSLRVVNCEFLKFGDSATALDHGIYVKPDWDIQIEVNRFVSSVGTGFGVQVYDETVTEANASPHQIIRGNRFSSALTARGVAAGGACSPLITDNTFENKTCGVSLNEGAPRISGNRFLGESASGSNIETVAAPIIAKSVVIENNLFLAKQTKIIVVEKNGDYIIRNNRFNPAANGSSWFVSVEGGEPNVRLVDNDFSGKGESGICRISSKGSLHAIGNTFLTSGGTCIELNSTTATVVIEGNNFSQSSGTSVVKTKTPATYRTAGNTGSAIGIQSVASGAEITLPEIGDVFSITGTTEIKSIAGYRPGRQVTLVFASTAKVTSGENLKLKESRTPGAHGTMTLVYDGEYWCEIV